MHSRKLILTIILSFTIFANAKERNYEEIFDYMQSNGISINEDIPMEKLFDMIESGKIYDNNGNINNELLKIKLEKLIKEKDKAFSKIYEEIDKNPNGKINQEVKEYLDSNNIAIDEEQKRLNKENNNSWQTNIINYVLDLMKF